MQLLVRLQQEIISLIGNVHKPFKQLVPLDTFTYAVCGASNTAFDIFLYFISYNFILQKQIVDLGFVAISPHIAAFIMAFCITFPTGFLLNKYITFTESKLRGIRQLFRYGLVVLANVGINYVFLKLFVEVFFWYPTPSKIVTTGIAIVFSFFAQKYFTFRVDSE
ncbi:MAG: GtrA family protein [Tenuifilaceae bacterium]|jgi:putative flippase GtrA|nr:GtrA family protein [Tenuifilaceae bacterium]